VFRNSIPAAKMDATGARSDRGDGPWPGWTMVSSGKASAASQRIIICSISRPTIVRPMLPAKSVSRKKAAARGAGQFGFVRPLVHVSRIHRDHGFSKDQRYRFFPSLVYNRVIVRAAVTFPASCGRYSDTLPCVWPACESPASSKPSPAKNVALLQ